MYNVISWHLEVIFNQIETRKKKTRTHISGQCFRTRDGVSGQTREETLSGTMYRKIETRPQHGQTTTTTARYQREHEPHTKKNTQPIRVEICLTRMVRCFIQMRCDPIALYANFLFFFLSWFLHHFLGGFA